MVSRTPRHQSQPRPSKSQTPSTRPGTSFDVTNDANNPSNYGAVLGSNGGGGGGHASYQYDQRRAKSSMRYQSNGRDSSRSKTRDGINIPGLQSSLSSSNLIVGREKQHRMAHVHANSGSGTASRPRAISAGRLRNSGTGGSQVPQQYDAHDPQSDPSSVARQILDLRERRESSQNATAAIQRAKSVSVGRSTTPHNKRPSGNSNSGSAAGAISPRGLVLKPAGSSQEEIQAEERLQNAESKINGLLQELEELKFFQEIEDEQPAPPTTPRAPRTPSRAQATAGGPPTTIRASSPARGGRLPPPPPANALTKSTGVNNSANKSRTNSGGNGGLETYKPLSPRSISKLDRNSLELECQTLVRKLQILEQDKSSHEATIEMYEVSLREHDADKAKVQKLEGELQKVSAELKKQLQNIQKGKETLVREYEEKLQNNLKKLHRTQEKADSYQSELQNAHADMEAFGHELEKYRNEASREKSRAEEMAATAETTQLQLEEARNLNATLVKKVEKKRSDLSNLKNDFSNTSKQLEATARDREEEFERQIQSLEQQLDSSNDVIAKLEQQCKEQTARTAEKEDELKQSLDRESILETQTHEMQGQIEELQQAVDARYEEGKKAAKTMETRKVQELVAERANAAREYERRLKAMQEQLRHQSDRHHAEIQDTREQNEKDLQAMKDSLRDEIRRVEGDRVNQLESELARLKRTYEGEKMSFSTKLQDAQTRAREATADFDRQDQMRQQEIEDLHEKLNSYYNDLSDRDRKLSELHKQLNDRQKTIQELGDLRKDDAIELEKREKLLEDERRKIAEMQSSFREEVASNKASFRELESSLRSEISSMREAAEESERKLSESRELLRNGEETKSELEKVQAELDKARDEFFTDRTNYENTESELRVELAKVQGKLRASESAINTKKARIEELESKIRSSSVSSRLGEEQETQMLGLQKRLDDMTNQAFDEREKAKIKEAEIDQLKLECEKFRDRLSSFARIEHEADEIKAKLSKVEAENARKSDELMDAKNLCETFRSRQIEAESKLEELKIDFERRLEKREQMISELDQQKSRLESDLSSLRKDYTDISALLEETMHSSSERREVDRKPGKRDDDIQESVDTHKKQLEHLERKMKDEVGWVNEELRSNIVELQSNVQRLEEEKMKVTMDFNELERRFKNVQKELIEYKELQQISRGGMEADVGRKDRHMREAVQRYMTTIADLESQLEEAGHGKEDLEDRLASARSELEDKQRHTEELVHRHTRMTAQLESELNKAKRDLDEQSRELKKKSIELEETVAKYNDENSEFREMSQSTRDELRRKEREIDDMSKQITNLTADLAARSRECEDLKISSNRQELELKQRKDQLNEVVARYSDQITELESKLDEHSVTTQGRVENVQAEASRKDKKIMELLKSITDLETKLEVSNRNRESVKQKSDSLARDLEKKDSDLRNLEVEKIELETKLHAHSRSKDELRAKITELSSRLERKEREVRDVSDRYKMYVMELESKLDQDTDAKHRLQSEIDKLRTNLNSAEGVSTEAMELRKKVLSLESTVDNLKTTAQESDSKLKNTCDSLQRDLDTATKSKDELEASLKKANSEKAEVIAALEGVINEVQNREDEIENLSDALQRREEELQHAKIIATKALQSAKDIQKKYKDREGDRHSDLMERMDEVADNVDRLTTKNEELQRKISTLERDLRDKKLECKRLKDQLTLLDGGKHFGKDEVSAVTTQSSYSTQSYPPNLRIEATSRQLEPAASLESASFSSTPIEYEKGVSPAGAGPYTSTDDFPSVERQYSGDFAFGGGVGDDRLASSSDTGARWIHDFPSSFDSFSTNNDPPLEKKQTRKSIDRERVEKDALRKYVQQRFTQRSTTNDK